MTDAPQQPTDADLIDRVASVMNTRAITLPCLSVSWAEFLILADVAIREARPIIAEQARAELRRDVIKEFRGEFRERWNEAHDDLHREGAIVRTRLYTVEDEYDLFADLLESMFDEWISADTGAEGERG